MTTKLPKQVQEAGERAEQALAERTAAAAAPEKPDEGTAAPAPTPSDPLQEPTPSSGEPSPAPPHPPAQPAQDRTDWKAKYHTLQGMYNADVPRLQKDLRAANDRIEALANELAELKAKQIATPPAPAPLPEPRHVTAPPALVEAVGQEAADAMMAALVEQVSGIRTDLGKDIEPVKEQAEAATKTAQRLAVERERERRDAFMRALTERVPDWQQIDEDERWRAFLAERDRFARRPRQELIAEAYRDGDLEAVAGFFEAFKEMCGLGQPVADPVPPVDPTSAPAPAADPRAHLQVPAPSGRSAAPAAGSKKLWTEAEIRKFYADVAKGNIPRDKAQEIEREIVKARAEGRIR
jgi:hypothetical protein